MITRKNTMIVLLACLSGLFGGCDSHATRKQALHDSWQIKSALERLGEVETLLERDDIESAAKLVDDCLKVAPSHAQANLLKGKVLFAQGNMVEALSYIRQAVQYDEKQHEGWYLLGILEDQQQGSRKAIESYNKALALDPGNVEYVIAIAEAHARQGLYHEAIRLLRDKAEVIPMSKELSIAEADLQLRQGNTEDAIDIYKGIVLFNGQDPEVLAALGYCYVIDGQWQQATEVFESLLENSDDGTKQTYLELLAVISVNNGQYARAVSYYDTLSLDRRKDAQLWLKMGHAALGANAPKRALACSKRVLSLSGNWPDAIALMGSAEYMNKDYNMAINTFSKIRGDKDLSCYAWFMTGKSLSRIGQYKKSSEAFKRAEMIDPENILISFAGK